MMDNQNNQQNIIQNNFNLYPPSNVTRKKKNKKIGSAHIRNYKKRIKSKNNNNNTQQIKINDQLIKDSSPYFLKVATLNIRSLNDIKIQNIGNLLKQQDLDVLSLTETRIKSKTLQFMVNQKLLNYEIFDTIDLPNVNSTGTVLIVKKDLAKYISKIEKHKGRVLKIEFIFSAQQRLSIISVYNKSGAREKGCIETRIEVNKEIIKMVKESRKQKHQIILMGDFNLKYKKYLQYLNNDMRIPEQYKIFELLEKEELFDICKEILQIDDNALTKNHVTFKKGTSASRIDYIWVSQKLLYETIKISIKEYNNTETDHNIIIAKFIRDSIIPPIELHKEKKTKNKNTRKKYLYDQLKEEDKELIINRVEEEFLKNTTRSSSNNLSISDKVENYYDIINTTKNELIPNVEINLREEKEDTKIKDLDLYRFIKFLTQLRRKIKKKKGIEKVKENWKIIVNHVIKTLKKWNIEEFYYIKSFTYSKILKGKYIEEINELYNIFYTKLQVKIASIKENKIKEAIKRRQQDLEFNQKRMIDNVMEREFKKINID
jgi:exonuclease III